MSTPAPTRRVFLRDGLLAAAAWGVAPLSLARAAAAADRRRDSVLVAVMLRGGVDALALAPRLHDPRLARGRPHLALRGDTRPAERLLDLDGELGLHPALAELEPWWRRDRLALVHGVGSPDSTRSHFDAQRNLEVAAFDVDNQRPGWLARAAAVVPGSSGSPATAVARCSSMPRSLRGGANTLVVPDLDALRLPIRPDASYATALESAWSDFPDPRLREAGAAASEALALAARAGRLRQTHLTTHERTPLGRSLADVADLIRADIGLRVAFVESGGWDTHARQGAHHGAFADAARNLATSLAAFMAALGEHRERVVVLTMTEFGRTVAENGSGGTDHGRASCFFVLGDRVRGGRVYGSIPELAPENLEDGRDLPVTVDFREVLAGVAGRHLGLRDLAPVFPGWSGKPLRIVRG